MGAIIAMLIKQKLAGKLAGLIVSKTQWGVSSVAVVALFDMLPAAMEGDPTAIGKVVLVVGGWLFALYGRLKARWA